MSPTAEDFEALREVEEAWLASELGRAIANLAYPVGCGSPPHDYHLKAAAKALFDRYAKMIEMAHGAAAGTLRDAVQYVVDKFKQDEAQGYHTKDRKFAIEILDKALSPSPSFDKSATEIARTIREIVFVDVNGALCDVDHCAETLAACSVSRPDRGGEA